MTIFSYDNKKLSGKEAVDKMDELRDVIHGNNEEQNLYNQMVECIKPMIERIKEYYFNEENTKLIKELNKSYYVLQLDIGDKSGIQISDYNDTEYPYIRIDSTSIYIINKEFNPESFYRSIEKHNLFTPYDKVYELLLTISPLRWGGKLTLIEYLYEMMINQNFLTEKLKELVNDRKKLEQELVQKKEGHKKFLREQAERLCKLRDSLK